MKEIKFNPTYTKPDGLNVVYDHSVPLPKGFKVVERGTVVFKPGNKGGNHKHPRIEAFYSHGDLTLIWLDREGKRIQKSMAPKAGKLTLFVTEANEPHAVINTTNSEIVLEEFANNKQHDVEPADLI